MRSKTAAKQYEKELNTGYKGLKKGMREHIEHYVHYCSVKDGERMKNTMKRILKLETDEELNGHFKRTFDLD